MDPNLGPGGASGRQPSTGTGGGATGGAAGDEVDKIGPWSARLNLSIDPAEIPGDKQSVRGRAVLKNDDWSCSTFF